jgi:histidine triad (HIT) family protein
MPTLFSKIISREISSYIVYEDEKVIAFLDVFPKQKGHTLVVPKQEVDAVYDLDQNTYTQVFLVAKAIAVALKKVFQTEKIAYLTLGLEVSHAHVHLVPIWKESDIHAKALSLSKDEFLAIQKQIIDALNTK